MKIPCLSVKCVLLTDKSAKNGTLSVNLNEILAESLSSTAFRSTGQNQSQIDRLRSVFHLIQARNGTFLIESDVISQGEELAFYKESVYNKRVGNISFEIKTNQDIVFQ